MDIDLTNEDLNMIASAISWSLYQEFYRSPPPRFSDNERQRMEGIHDSICRYRHEAGDSFKAGINGSKFVLGDTSLTSSHAEVGHIIQSVESFRGEIGHSPDEVSAVTGMPISLLNSLNDRLSKLEIGECV